MPTRWSPPSSGQSNVQQSDNEDMTDTLNTRREPWFRIDYPDNSLLFADKFRLIYVTQSGDVLGVSEPFNITD